MESNEICMFMDVKLNITKHGEVLRFKSWTRCSVKIEAIKCLPCFLRITFTPDSAAHSCVAGEDEEEQIPIHVSIIVPGVTISLAASRTKQHSYGLFWTQNRRDCFIYFALETEASCRRHMKWIKKSIKNLELYRLVFLEQRRHSRGPGVFGQLTAAVPLPPLTGENAAQDENGAKDSAKEASQDTPTKSIDYITFDGDSSNFRASHISDIYEEIFEGNETPPPHLLRRLSRTSIASGIYEEMKCTSSNFHVIVEEAPEPPPRPPLPRKRINTFEHENLAGLLGEIPRSNTNPECELAKKKKYKNVLANIFGSGRSKRTKSVSETQACSTEDVIACHTPKHHKPTETAGDSPGQTPLYANEAAVIVARKRHRKPLPRNVLSNIADSKRNSFSSPDLSKINFLADFDEEKAPMLNDAFDTSSDALDLSSHSLDESSIVGAIREDRGIAPTVSDLLEQMRAKERRASVESVNISQQIPQNFNFSACNTSTINLMGAHAAQAPNRTSNRQKNMLMDDLSGYCFMAPIKKKVPSPLAVIDKPTQAESTSSGYSTRSYSTSSTSSCTNSSEDQMRPVVLAPPTIVPLSTREESTIYEEMHISSLKASQRLLTTPPTRIEFDGNLYENMITIKAARELEQLPNDLATSTPTESPLTGGKLDTAHDVMLATPTGEATTTQEEEESFYQTPRKSIISVDEKIPSYYPNSCETVKTRRQSQSPPVSNANIDAHNSEKLVGNNNCSVGMRHLKGVMLRRSPKEQHRKTPEPQEVPAKHHNGASPTCSNTTNTDARKQHRASKKVVATAAQKISDNVYAVMRSNSKGSSDEGGGKRRSQRKSTKAEATAAAFNEELKEKLQKELLQMTILQKIDFKFDDTKALTAGESIDRQVGEQENCYQSTTRSASRLVEKYVNLSPRHMLTPTSRSPARQLHHLQTSQEANKQTSVLSPAGGTPSAGDCVSNGATSTTISTMTQSKLEVPITSAASSADWRKFTSLPRFKKIDFSPLKMRLNNVLQRNQTPPPQQEF